MSSRGRKSPRPRAAAPTRGALLVLALAIGISLNASALKAAPNAAYLTHQVSGATADTQLTLLQRPAPSGRLRFRIAFIPGSGCSGLAPLVSRLFAGLQHAEVWVIHKPGVDVQAGAAPTACPPGFVAQDDLSQWLQHARAALQAVRARTVQAQEAPTAPWLLVGVSEGAELLPFLAPDLPDLRGLIMVGGSGLNPVEAGALQAQALGEARQWQDLALAQASPRRPDHEVVDGRTLRYWRSLWAWRNAEAALALSVPLVQVHGERDQAVPSLAYERFAARALGKAGGFCAWTVPEADHGLQGPGGDGYQRLWAALEDWGQHHPQQSLCESMQKSGHAQP